MAKQIAEQIDKALKERLDEATIHQIVERTVKDAAAGDRAASVQLVTMMRYVLDVACW